MSFCPFLYLKPEHLGTQSTGLIFSFLLFTENIPAPCGIFHCAEPTPGHWVSPLRAPFGGIQVDKNCKQDDLDFLVCCIKEFIAAREGKKLIVKTAPLSYYAAWEYLRLDYTYRSAGFTVSGEFINHSIPVDSDGFTYHIAASENRKLKRAKAAGFRAGLEQNLPAGFIHSFLFECRTLKGYSLTLSQQQIEELLMKFKEEVKIFTVRDSEKIIALSLTVRVSRDIIYNFLSADVPDYRHYSPYVILTETIYSYCRKEGIATLDLGISLDHTGIHKPSLARFKQNIGGKESVKRTYELTF
ncbi:GNAT family N-acetyltransferase [Dyadobacter bucti]|uniref:GNAT family N-acetyltransferase n=1 Tax=Dyadobacter bucti TaxID=2572203 RepID=UPI003F6E48DE